MLLILLIDWKQKMIKNQLSFGSALAVLTIAAAGVASGAPVFLDGHVETRQPEEYGWSPDTLTLDHLG